ncbi:uncharacterized protein LOC111339132 [Stylophora pistillata]|uniref:uncharacterized protein LOC111339132 n=1 Tax=Stylophora pistillata TaxID=50429 RepID=UPI000C0568B9|nr:uncharacterized protein LOC111339132 [Stylophora pistillata]
MGRDPEWARARSARQLKSTRSPIGKPKEHSEAKPKIKPKPEWKTASLRKKEASKSTKTQSEYWQKARPDWAKGKSPIDKPKIPEKPKPKAKDYWEEAKPEWSKGKSSISKPSAGDIKKLAEKKKYEYPTPEWATPGRNKDKASDEQDGNKGLLKAELESIFGKPKPIVKQKRPHSSQDIEESYRASIRKFADHRRNLKVKTKHRPTSNPVRQLLSREDVRSEL